MNRRVLPAIIDLWSDDFNNPSAPVTIDVLQTVDFTIYINRYGLFNMYINRALSKDLYISRIKTFTVYTNTEVLKTLQVTEGVEF